jgi:probable phosphomutase (TIGR03848 family)
VTRFYLVRHGANDFIGKRLAGRLAGVHLNDEGRTQAEQVAERLSQHSISRIFSSPLDRTLETAEPLARRLNIPVEISPAILEIDFGDWTGKTLDELSTMPDWKQWNLFRSGFRIPGGEHMADVQARMLTFIDEVRCKFQNENVALFSHGDPIKAALIYFLGAPLDLLPRIEIDPASVSIVAVDDWGPKVLSINS